MVGDSFDDNGYRVFPPCPDLRAWAEAAHPLADAALQDPALRHWHVCQGTWFVGIDAIANDASGAVAATPLAGAAIEWIIDRFGSIPPLHRAQASVVFPGYPRPRDRESDAAFRYRARRDAAHVDGILAVGSGRRRYIREPHGWILGLPLNDAPVQAAPLVVWEGSHRLIRTALSDALAPHPQEIWGDVDVTDAYHAARRVIFDTCRRVPVTVPQGAAIVLHPLALHGVAPWASPAGEPRKIAYFRPPVAGDIADWLAI